MTDWGSSCALVEPTFDQEGRGETLQRESYGNKSSKTQGHTRDKKKKKESRSCPSLVALGGIEDAGDHPDQLSRCEPGHVFIT